MIVKVADKEDLPEVVKLVNKGLMESGEDTEPELVADTVIQSFYLCPVFCLIDDDKIVGVVPLRLSVNFWSKKHYLTSLIYYILKSHRTLGNIRLLTKSVQDFAKLHRLPYRDTFYGKDKHDGRSRLLQANGFNQVGIAMEYNNGK